MLISQPVWALCRDDRRTRSPTLSSEVKRRESAVGPHAHHPLLQLIFEQLKQRNQASVRFLIRF
jgi:hypothetical protein